MTKLQVRATGVLGLVCFLVVASPMVAQNGVPSATASGIDAVAAEVLKSTGAPSASVAVVQGGKVAYVKAYGMARLDPPMAAEPAMQYSIGSVSKQFTATVVLLLMQDGKLKLDDPVGKYLPGLTRANEVTIRQVLSMTSGYQDFWPEDYVMTSMMKATTPQQISGRVGEEAAGLRPGNAVAVLEYELCDCGADRRDCGREAAD